MTTKIAKLQAAYKKQAEYRSLQEALLAGNEIAIKTHWQKSGAYVTMSLAQFTSQATDKMINSWMI